MQAFFRAVGGVSFLMASAVKLILGAIVVLVVVDVALRNLGYRPLAWGVSATEYGLLYAAFLPMPWLVRIKGHVFVEFLRKTLSPARQAALGRIVYAVCTLLCLYLTWYAVGVFLDAWATGAYETRTFDMPQSLIFLPMVLGFFVASLEWLRYLLGFDDLYDVDILDREGL